MKHLMLTHFYTNEFQEDEVGDKHNINHFDLCMQFSVSSINCKKMKKIWNYKSFPLVSSYFSENNSAATKFWFQVKA